MLIISVEIMKKKFSDRLSSFERCWSSLLRLLTALRRNLSRIDKVSLLQTFSSLKVINFGYTPSCLQLLRKSMSNFSLFYLYSSFSYFRKSLTVTFPCFCAISLQIFMIFLDSTKRKIEKRKRLTKKDPFVALSISVIKNSNIFQKNSVYPKTFFSLFLR